MKSDTVEEKTQTSPKPQGNTPGASPVSAKKKVSTKTRGKGESTQSPKLSKFKGSTRTKTRKQNKKVSTKSTKKAMAERKKKAEESKRKTLAKDLILKLIRENGLSWVTAAATVRNQMNYHRTTLYKWLDDVQGKDDDKKDVTFRDFVRMAERLVIGEFERAQLKAAKGGALTGWHQDTETQETFQSDGKTLKKRVVKSKRGESFSAPSPQASKDGLNRRCLRDRRIDKKPDELERVPDPIVEAAVDEDGNVVMPFEKLCVTFADLMSKMSSKGQE